MSYLIKPANYKALLDLKQTELGIKQIKEFFQQNLSSELRLRRVTAPLFVLKGMGINDAVGSPTFMIMNYYEGVLPLKHFDFYRLGDEKDLYNIGWEEYSSGGVTVVEWADVFPALLPPESITVHIERINETMRHISLCWGKGAPESVVKEIIKYVACH